MLIRIPYSGMGFRKNSSLVFVMLYHRGHGDTPLVSFPWPLHPFLLACIILVSICPPCRPRLLCSLPGRSIQYTLSSMLFNVLPTILEISELMTLWVVVMSG